MFKDFDFSWFMTTPGIFTCVGCVLIILAFIIFLTSLSKKGKDVKSNDIPSQGETITPLQGEAPLNSIAGTEAIDFSKTMQPTAEVNNVNLGIPVQPTVDSTINIQTASDKNFAIDQSVQIAPEPVSVGQIEQPVNVMPTIQSVEIQPINEAQVSQSLDNFAPTMEPIKIEPTNVAQVSQPLDNFAPTMEPIKIEPTNEAQVSQSLDNFAPTMEPIKIEPTNVAQVSPTVDNFTPVENNSNVNTTTINQETDKEINGGINSSMEAQMPPEINNNFGFKPPEDIENL